MKEDYGYHTLEVREIEDIVVQEMSMVKYIYLLEMVGIVEVMYPLIKKVQDIKQ